MYKKIGFFIFIFFFLVFAGNCAQVKINAEVYKESTIFQYTVIFNSNESYTSFSFEKPKDTKMIYSLEDNINIEYVSAGDYFIFRPDEETGGKNFTIKFVSTSTSKELLNSGIFSMYANFNFPIEALEYDVSFKQDFGTMVEVFPRNYETSMSKDIIWKLSKIENDTLFLVKFNVTEEKSNSLLDFFDKYWHIILILIVLIFLIRIVMIFKKKEFFVKMIPKNFDRSKIVDSSKSVNAEEINEEKFEELTSKYLTENEKEVVEVVRSNQGISQFDILNHLPKMNKSNLSKIISKLDSKQILSRIKVGKINKIYLGERVEKVKLEEPNIESAEKLDEED